MTEILVLIALMVANGLFAMSEAAVIAARRARLQQRAGAGDRRARAALRLAEDPNRFLSTVQIGITLIGIVAGVFGGATIAAGLEQQMARVPALAPAAGPLSYVLVVALTTYLSLVIGELVPKRLALQHPERIASLVAIPMRSLALLAAPVVSLLTKSTDGLLWVLGVRGSDDPPVTAGEITTMVRQGVDAGVFTEREHEIVEGVFRLNDRRVEAMMTPRTDILWLNIQDAPQTNLDRILQAPFSRFLVCDGDLDQVLGVVNTRALFVRAVSGEAFDLAASMDEAMFVPESLLGSGVLEQFKANRRQVAVVLGEHGGVEGLVTMQDLLEEMVGGMAGDSRVEIVEREDGSLLLDGMMDIDEVKSAIRRSGDLPGEHDDYHTLGGFVMAQLGRVPRVGEVFEWDRVRYEVVDMDGNRVDKVLVLPLGAPEGVLDDEAVETE